MPRYVITERAGRFVAGHTNTGVGTVLDLSERAAAHEVRLGTLRPSRAANPEDHATVSHPEEPASQPDDDDTASKRRRRSKPSTQ